MSEKLAGEIAITVTEIAKLSANPVIMDWRKLCAFATEVGLEILVDKDSFHVHRGRKRLYSSETTAGLNEWFKEKFLEDVLA